MKKKSYIFNFPILQGSGDAVQGGASSSRLSAATGLNDTADKAAVEEASVNVSLRVELLRSMRTTLLKKTDEALKKIEAASATTSTTKKPARGRKATAAATASRLQKTPASFHQNSESFYYQEIYERMKAVLARSSLPAGGAAGGGGGGSEEATQDAQDALNTFISVAKDDVLKEIALTPSSTTTTNTAPARKKQSRCLDLEGELPAPCLHHHLNCIEETILRPALFGTTPTPTPTGTIIAGEMAEKKSDRSKSANGCSGAVEILTQHVYSLQARGIVVLQEPSNFLNIERNILRNVEGEVRKQQQEGEEVQEQLATTDRRQLGDDAVEGAVSFEDAFGVCGGDGHGGVDAYEWPDEIMVGEEENVVGQGDGEFFSGGGNSGEEEILKEQQQQQNKLQLRSLPPPPSLRRAVPNFAARSGHPLGMTNAITTTPDTARDEEMDDEDIEDSDNEEEIEIERQEEARPVLRSVIIPQRRPLPPQQQQRTRVAQPLRLNTVQTNPLEFQENRKDGEKDLLAENTATFIADIVDPTAVLSQPLGPPASGTSPLPTAPASLPLPLPNLGPRFTVQWDGPTRDPLALRPSIFLNEWRGTKPRWKPQPRVEDLLLPQRQETRSNSSSRGYGEGSGIDAVLNLPTVAINSELFTQQLLGGGGGGRDKGKFVVPAGRTMAVCEGEEGDWNIWKQQARLLAAEGVEARVHGSGGDGAAGSGGGAAVRDAWDLLEEEAQEGGPQHQQQQQRQVYADDFPWWDSGEEEEEEKNYDNKNEAVAVLAAAEEDNENESLVEVNFEDDEEDKNDEDSGEYKTQLDNEVKIAEPASARAVEEMEEVEVEINEEAADAVDAERGPVDDDDSIIIDDDYPNATNGADAWACFEDEDEEEDQDPNLREEYKRAAREDGGGGRADGFAVVDVVMECDEYDDMYDDGDLLLQDYDTTQGGARCGAGGAGGGGLVEINYEDQDDYDYNASLSNNKHHNTQQERQQQQELKILQKRSDIISESALKEWHAQQKINAIGNGKLVRHALTQALIKYQQESHLLLNSTDATVRTSTRSKKKSVLLSVLKEECAAALKTSSTSVAAAVPFVVALSALLSIVHTTNTNTTRDARNKDAFPNEQQQQQSVFGPLKLKATRNKQDVEIFWYHK